MAGTPGAATASTTPETVIDGGDAYVHPLAVVPVTMNVLFAFFVRPRTWIDPLDAELLIVALWPVFAVAVNVVQGDVYVGAVKTTVRVTPPTAAVAVHEFLAASHPPPATSPRMTGALTSDALSPEPPHPARNITAHATTATAAFAWAEPETNAPKRPERALIVGRASPGQGPIIEHVIVTVGGRGRARYRGSTVDSRQCPHYPPAPFPLHRAVHAPDAQQPALGPGTSRWPSPGVRRSPGEPRTRAVRTARGPGSPPRGADARSRNSETTTEVQRTYDQLLPLLKSKPNLTSMVTSEPPSGVTLRFVEREVEATLVDTPVTVIQGARQVGKSALARTVTRLFARVPTSSSSTRFSGFRH